MRWCLLWVTILFLVGCVHKPLPVVYACPVIKLPPEPIAETKKINKHSSPDFVVKAFVADLRGYKQWCNVVERQVLKSS